MDDGLHFFFFLFCAYTMLLTKWQESPPKAYYFGIFPKHLFRVPIIPPITYIYYYIVYYIHRVFTIFVNFGAPFSEL